VEMLEQAPPKAPDSEKITINLGYVDLGHIDLLVAQGFYSNRTDLIRTAIRSLLDRHDSTLKKAVKKTTVGPRPAALQLTRPRARTCIR